MIERLLVLNDSLRRKIKRNKKLPYATKRMILLHLEKPWVLNHVGILISPAYDDLEEYLGEDVLIDDERVWYVPSMVWWEAHAKASHPPDGSGCDSDVHTEYLTSRGVSYEFDYSNVLVDGTLDILTRRDFVEECHWWI